MNATLLCLHGWGGTKESFTELKAALEGSGITVLAPDLPGFGSEPEPDRPWTNDDYADWMEDWLRQSGKWKVESGKLFLLGHSHGGRLSIKIAARNSLPIAHLFLCAPAGIRHGQYLKKGIGWLMAKTGKALLSIPLVLNRFQPIAKKFLYRLLRTHDYETASPMMRQMMVRVTSENIQPYLKHITVPTDIFWGKDDKITPLSDAYLMEKEIPKATLHVYPNVRHGVHRDRAKEIAEVIRERVGN